jgi:hypothetical protein
MTIAALYVEKGGAYWDLPNVDPWDIDRDARSYPGPYPVVAHPPCKRWGRYWSGGPSCKERKLLGDDAGCFATALWAVRTFGGVLEHPEASKAWDWFGMLRPLRGGGWCRADMYGWTCCVEQGHYGHRARKATWLYLVGANPPSLRWGTSELLEFRQMDRGFHSAEERRMFTSPPKGMSPEWRAKRNAWLARREAAGGKAACGPERMGLAERLATPEPFRDLLIGMARSVTL